MSHPVIAPVEIDVPATLAVQLDAVSSSVPAEIGAAMAAAFPRVAAFVGAHDLQCIGAPRAIYTTFTALETRFTVAIPVAPPTDPLATEGGVEVRELPARRALRFTHHGPYDQLHATYREITGWLIAHKYIESEAGWAKFSPMWEEYVSDPDVVPPAELVTQIYVPVG